MIDSVCELKPVTVLACGALILAFATARAPAATEIETARVKDIAAELPPTPAGFGRPITDCAAWAKLTRAALSTCGRTRKQISQFI